jgi:hypothetical protein
MKKIHHKGLKGYFTKDTKDYFTKDTKGISQGHKGILS